MSLRVDVTKMLGAFTLNAHFEAPEGITALFGPSGSGKTLTLRCVSGLLAPDRGIVALHGRPLFDHDRRIDVPTRERRVGYVFQSYALFPHLSARANIAYGLFALTPAEREARVEALLALMDLDQRGDLYPRQLSGGQQQRVALARALAPRPEFVLLDEPFAAVDTHLRKRLRERLRAIQGQTGVSMLLVTHDIGEVLQLADTTIIYRRGEVVQAGSTAEVLATTSGSAWGDGIVDA